MIHIDRAQEEARVYHNVQRSKRVGLEATLAVDEWINTIEQFNGLCAYCQNVPFEALDHIIPVLFGGQTTANNCVPSCRKCNTIKCAVLIEDALPTDTLLELVDKVKNALKRKTRRRRTRAEIDAALDLELSQSDIQIPRSVTIPLANGMVYVYVHEPHEKPPRDVLVWLLKQQKRKRKRHDHCASRQKDT